MTDGLLGDKSTNDIILLTQGGTIREWSEVLPDGRIVTYTAEVEEEVITEEEDIEINGYRVVTTCSKENSQQVETVIKLAEGEVIKVTKTNSRSVTGDNGSTTEILKNEEIEGGMSETLEHSIQNKLCL